MKKNFKRIIALGLAGIAGFTIVACENNQKTATEIDVFSAYITDKILQDMEVDASQKAPAKFDVSVAKGEKEASQIIVCPNQDVQAYTLTLNDLKNENGTIFSKENMQVFHQKYITVKVGSNGLDSPLGNYPDILMPMDTAIFAGENKILQGQNQAVIVEVNVPKDQESGVYTGTYTLQIDDKQIDVDVRVEVWNVSIGEEVHTATQFALIRDELIYGELDNSWEMYAKYVDKLLEYRVSPYKLPVSDGDTKGYAEKVKEYYQNKAFASYCIPTSYQWGEYTNEKMSWYQLDKEAFKEYIVELVKLSLQDNVNYLSKANTYSGIIDEPEINGTVAKASAFLGHYNTVVEEIANEIQMDESLVGENKAEIVESIRGLHNIVTNKQTSILENVKNWCPTIDGFDMELNRADYYKANDNNEEYWWYTCNNPVNPYPSYHLDDTDGLLSARSLSWMQKEYNVSGNLYWTTALYRKIQFVRKGTTRTYINAYEDAERYPGTNGDGFLLYPGAPYGVDGPIASNRLMSIRDGLEDYELLYALENNYNQLQVSKNDADDLDNTYDGLELLYNRLYTGTKHASDSQTFYTTRAMLAGLLALSESKAQVAIEDVQYTKKDTRIRLQAKSGEDVYANGKKLISVETKDGKDYYEIVLDMTENNNVLELEASQTKVKLFLGGKRSTVSDFEEKNTSIIKSNSTIKECKYISVDGAENALKIEWNTGENKVADFAPSNISSLINNSTQEFGFYVYNPMAEDVHLRVSIKGDNTIAVAEEILKSGWNFIQLTNIYANKWKLIRKVEALQIRVLNHSDKEVALYFDEFMRTAVAK